MRRHSLALLLLVLMTRAAHADPEQCTCELGGTVEYQPIYVPFTLLNGNVGDALLHRGSAGGGLGAVVTMVLREIGMSYTHAAMVTRQGADGSVQEISQYNARPNLGDLVDYLHVRLDSHALAHMGPGLERMTFDDFIRRYGFNVQTAQVLHASSPGAGARAAAVATGLDGWYRIQAFTNLVYMNHADPGTMCSGMIHWAWERSGAGRIPPRIYPASIRASAAARIYGAVHQIIVDMGIPVLGDWAADRVANQVVNCFLDLGCGETDDRWRGNPGTGYTVGPDDLQPRGDNSAYTSQERMSTAGGYYTDRPWCRLPSGGTYPAQCTGEPGGGGGTGSGALPIAVVLTPESTTAGNVSFTYALWDAESDRISITVEYSADGGTTWSLATAGPGGDPLTNLAANPDPGVAHQFVWDTRADYIGITQLASDVRLRVTPSDGRVGQASETAGFVVDNTELSQPCTFQGGPYTTGYCGDGLCDPTMCETPYRCSQDCGSCGDGYCGSGELSDLGGTATPPGRCAADCGRCGDGVCMGGETVQNCVADCGSGCGDRVCRPEDGETPESCPTDCGGPGACGNGRVDDGETCATCPQDVANRLRFTIDPPYAAPGQLVTFTADASLIAEPNPSWDFGDAVHERGNPISHLYTGPGTYQVKLTATENACFVTVVSDPTPLTVGSGDVCGGYCGDDLCCTIDDAETDVSCPQDCAPQCDTCGNDVCGACEDAGSCPADCGGGGGCGDGSCDEGEGCDACPADCGVCPPGCGDSVCEPEVEDCGVCPQDCPCAPGTSCQNRQCVPSCGNGTCGSGESCHNCEQDCGVCPEGCGDGACEPGVEDCGVCPEDCPCWEGTVCHERQCVPPCGDGVCAPDEDCGSCAADCGACPAVCGDHVCTPVDEDCGICPEDCPCWMEGTRCEANQCVTYCGNGVCDGSEDCWSCNADCGGGDPCCGQACVP